MNKNTWYWFYFVQYYRHDGEIKTHNFQSSKREKKLI